MWWQQVLPEEESILGERDEEDREGGTQTEGRGDPELSWNGSPENGRVTWWGKKEKLARRCSVSLT